MLTNPNYLKELSEKQNEENKFYQEVYENYQKGDFLNTIAQADQGLSKYKGSKLESKFSLLKSLSIGKTSDLHTFRTSLNEIVEKYPKTEVSDVATNILEYIRKQELRLASVQTKDTVKNNIETVKTEDVKTAVTYKEPKGEHLFIAVVPKKSNLNQLKFNLVSFNVDAFINIDLSVNSQPLNEFFDLIRVEKFKDSKQVMEYYQAIMSKEGLFNPLKPEDYTLFVISSENYSLFLVDKSLVDYLKFFNSTYK
jgi:hypothetical protein